MRLIDADALKQSFEEDGHLSGYIEEYIDEQPTIDAEPVRHGRCDMCDIKETGHGLIWIYGNGWQVCIRQKGTFYDIVINHCGDQISIPIEFCPECGAKMDTRPEPSRGCATCANDGMDMPQCRECIEHQERPWYRPKDGGAE